MPVQLIKETLQTRQWKHNCFLFLPDAEQHVGNHLALFAHGYTSNKSSILNWPTRLAEEGMPALVMDIPGHFQGSFHEVDDFGEFCEHVHEIFLSAKKFAEQHKELSPEETIVLGGHSMGALLSLKALGLPEFQKHPTLSIGVGFGWPPEETTHIFQTPFYKSTLNIRRQLVSEAISPDRVFPWIKKQKKHLDLTDAKVHLICGEDDVIVGENGADKLAESLKELGNDVTLEKPRKLPHHQPDMAGAHVKKFLKKQNLFSGKA